MSMELTEMEELQRLVESAEPREIISNALKNLNSLNSYQAEALSELLGFTDKDVEVIYIHKHFKYERKKHGNNMFLYLDKDGDIMAILQGTKRNPEWQHYEFWRSAKNLQEQEIDDFWIVKNKKNLRENAYHVLMFHKKWEE